MTSRSFPSSPHDCLPSLPAGRAAGAFLYTEGDDLYAAMTDSIEAAQHEIGFESYLFADDEVGRRFADVLSERASAGVRVRLLLDAEGCRSRWSKRLARRLGDSGAEVRMFRPWRWGRLR